MGLQTDRQAIVPLHIIHFICLGCPSDCSLRQYVFGIKHPHSSYCFYVAKHYVRSDNHIRGEDIYRLVWGEDIYRLVWGEDIYSLVWGEDIYRLVWGEDIYRLVLLSILFSNFLNKIRLNYNHICCTINFIKICDVFYSKFQKLIWNKQNLELGHKFLSSSTLYV